ncbi:DUF1254 domain-containing protein [Paraburkholderia bryophila]|uniref:DUF1254 domain-containing protein n=1 Tax=Paraburkholderia bryophila TaxID=420952 RepID=A0A7Y9WCZ0_9BURK|nr:DUF1254 domain-containing protein [Paraburkholderia bryophila]NYH18535.1 hypothetical protein [Paraburkholderia bryophila]
MTLTNHFFRPRLIGLLLAASFAGGFAHVGVAATPDATRAQAQPIALSAADMQSLARDLYYYAYPIVLMDITMRQATDVPDARSVPMRAPQNQFAHFRSYPKADARDVVRFNFDTLYSLAWLDLRNGPVILSVPDTQGRYYLVPSLDMWTDVFASVGSRTTGTRAGRYAYVPPGWHGTLPAGVQRIDAPTSTIWLMARIQTNGPEDYKEVRRLQDGFELTPLNPSATSGAVADSAPGDAGVDARTPPLVQVNRLSGVEMLTRLSQLMARYPAHADDYPILFRAQALGIVPGKTWDPARLDNATRDAINAGAKEALQRMTDTLKTGGQHVDGWSMVIDNIGTYGTSYRHRAVIALAGLGANLPADAIYPTAFRDSEGKPLDGANRYVLHFDKDSLPPADAFWSLTMYDHQGFQVPNPLERFALGSHDKLRFNADGSLDLYIQHDSPGADKESNWLPSPASGSLGPTLRVYSPRADALDGKWAPPGFQRVR